MSVDGVKWWPTIEVVKYDAPLVAELTALLGHEPTGIELADLRSRGAITPDDVLMSEGNALLTGGLGRLTDLIIGTAAGAFTATGGFMCVGDSSTAFSVAHTDLQASTNKAYIRVASAPTRSTTTVTNDSFTASVTFGASEANFTWAEWAMGAVASGSASASAVTALASVGTTPVLFNRKVDALGTKGSGSSWTLTAKIKLS